jgi:pimeloyl-ACP methyl ester carboxylesterase
MPALLVSMLVAAMAGLVTDVFAVRGPTTAAQGVGVMLVALAVGVAGGMLVRSRWVLLPQLLAFLAGVELGRVALDVPSLAIRFDNVYGVISFVITRGVHLVLLIVPMATGVAVGILLARRRDGTARAGRKPVGTALLGVATVALIALVMWPASTPPVVDEAGTPVDGAIAELATVRLGDTEQTVLIRGADPDKPVLLYLSGGPGQSNLALGRVLSDPWLNDFVVADLDQRGNGKSYAAIDPLSAMTLDRAVADVIELTEYLRERFDERKIYLMGESWGTILGVLAVQQRPDLYHAYIGSGQMADVLETDRRIYDDLGRYATSAGDADLAAKLTEIGRPPYRDIPWANSNLLAWYEYLYKPYTPSAGYMARGDASGLDPFGVLGSEYTFLEKANVIRGLIDTFTVMYPQLYDLDFRAAVPRLDVPVYVLDGLAELDGRRDVMLEWFDGLEAPVKERVEYAGAAHSVAFEQADEVLRLLTETIVPNTYDR